MVETYRCPKKISTTRQRELPLLVVPAGKKEKNRPFSTTRHKKKKTQLTPMSLWLVLLIAAAAAPMSASVTHLRCAQTGLSPPVGAALAHLSRQADSTGQPGYGLSEVTVKLAHGVVRDHDVRKSFQPKRR
jgi:hypothetical protein